MRLYRGKRTIQTTDLRVNAPILIVRVHVEVEHVPGRLSLLRKALIWQPITRIKHFFFRVMRALVVAAFKG